MLKVINIPLSSDLIRVENPDDLCLKKEGRNVIHMAPIF